MLACSRYGPLILHDRGRLACQQPMPVVRSDSGFVWRRVLRTCPGRSQDMPGHSAVRSGCGAVLEMLMRFLVSDESFACRYNMQTSSEFLESKPASTRIHVNWRQQQSAQAVLAALQKGRSSAPTLRHQVGQAGAIIMACGWRFRFAYLPSESNPADAPSRRQTDHEATEGCISAVGPSL